MSAFRPLLAVLALLLAVPAAAAGQVTRGSTLAAPSTTSFGCESSVQQDFTTGLFLVTPMGHPSCTWWSSGIASQPTSPNTGFVPSSGLVTNVRVKSGPNPAPMRIVQLRSTAGCCVGVRQTDIFQPTPNAVTQVTVNWLVEVVRDATVGVSTNDIIGFSAGGGSGTIPVADQGLQTHTAQAAFAPGVHSGTMTVPKVEPGTQIGLNYRAATGYEPLLQYDFVACPALNNRPVARAAQAGCPGTSTPPPQPPVTPVTPPVVTRQVPPPRPIVDLRSTRLRLRDGRIALRVACQRATLCRGRLRIRTRGARPRLLSSTTIAIPAGKTRTIKAKLSRRNRSLLRRRTTTPLAVELDLGRGAKVVETVTFRR